MTVQFSPPDISELEIERVAEVLRSGWITTGSKVKEFERKIAAFCGVNRAVCLNSQTACAELALRLLDVGPGDEVITSAYTYTASASVICHVGARPVLVDIQAERPEMDYEKLENAITDRTKAIIPVDIAGIPCDYERIYEVVEKMRSRFRPSGPIQKALGRVAILADTAHSFGARRKGKTAGSLADFSAFSFHAVKNLTTAEGGALVWRKVPGIDDEEIYKMLQLFSLHGQSKDALEKTKLGAWEYNIVGTWYKCNMTDIAAALGLAQLERYGEMLDRRRALIRFYDSAFLRTGIKLVGITNAKLGDSFVYGETSQVEGIHSVDNMGYALPITQVMYVVDNIMDNGGSVKRATLGVTVQTVESKSILENGKAVIVETVSVADITKGSAGDGIFETGDILKSIIVGNTKTEIRRRYQVIDLLLCVRKGDTVKVTVERDGKATGLSITFDKDEYFTAVS